VSNVKILDNFDFDIDDDLNQRRLVLKRGFEKETVMVKVFNLVHIASSYDVDQFVPDMKDEYGKILLFDKHIDGYMIELLIRNTRVNNVCLEFGMTVY
jgi:hypothetical protein